MKIQEISIDEVKVPLRCPFKTALRTVTEVNDIIVKVTAEDGTTGYGEAAPTAVITGDTKASIQSAIMDYIRPAIMGVSLDGIEDVMDRMDHCIVKNTSAKAAVDMAIYDLYAKSLSKPLYQVLGGYRNSLETDLTISVNPIAEMVQDSLLAVKEGFRILKIKVGKEGLKDVERIKEIRNAVGDDIKIRVDANQGWDVKQSMRIITAMEDLNLNIDLVEQPVKASDFAGMQYITNHVNTRILADESVFSPQDAIHIIKDRAADLINIKLMKTGGIHQALKICDIAELYQVECMIGCMLESKISVSAAAHLAGGKKNITMADLDGPSLCKIDPYEGGPEFKQNMIHLNQTVGLGIKKVPCF